MVDISDAALDLTKDVQLTGTELVNRALARVHSGHSDQAIEDAENVSRHLFTYTRTCNLNVCKSINIRPSVNGYIAKSVALISGGKKAEGCRIFDLAFRHCDAMSVDLTLLIKVCIFRPIELDVNPQLVILIRQLSFSWPENTTMLYCA